MAGEGGSWTRQDLRLGNGFYQLVSNKPLVAFKVVSLIKIIEMGGSPIVKIALSKATIIEGYFDGVVFENGSFKLDICSHNQENIKVEPLAIDELFIIDPDCEHINQQSIERSLKLDQEIANYFQTGKVGGGGVF
jgi:hypothetical protein